MVNDTIEDFMSNKNWSKMLKGYLSRSAHHIHHSSSNSSTSNNSHSVSALKAMIKDTKEDWKGEAPKGSKDYKEDLRTKEMISKIIKDGKEDWKGEAPKGSKDYKEDFKTKEQM